MLLGSILFLTLRVNRFAKIPQPVHQELKHGQRREIILLQCQMLVQPLLLKLGVQVVVAPTLLVVQSRLAH